MSIYKKKHELYQEYCRELDLYRSIPIVADDSTVDIWCDDYINDPNCTWRNIFDKESGDLVGFLIIGKNGSEKHPDADYGIAQAYVKPEFRKIGLMTSAVHEYLEKHNGIYSLLVIKNNEYALKFWSKLFAGADYKTCNLDERFVNDNGDELVLLGFKPSKN